MLQKSLIFVKVINDNNNNVDKFVKIQNKKNAPKWFKIPDFLGYNLFSNPFHTYPPNIFKLENL